MRFKKVIIITALMLLVFPCSVFFAAINVFNTTAVTINSNYPLTTGPNMPFPQFKNYKAGGQTTLYSLSDFAHQPDGVSHAEMEQWISEGWQIFANRFAYTGAPDYRLANGAAPVNFQLVNAQANNDNCSEGQGYALLCAALMADKKTFDGIWFWLVENGRLMNARKYSDGTWVSRGTNGANFGQHFISVYSPPGDSATDGDVDIAMALLLAWYQWGDFTGYYATGGHGPETNTGGLKAIKYKDMALAAIRYLVALDLGDDHTNQPRDWITGVVGFDGYHKGGNTQNENTNFVPSPNGVIDSWDGPYGFTEGPAATNENFYDYTGPSYWRAFADALTRNNAAQDLTDATKLRWNGTAFGRFNVDQLERAAASDFWLQGRLNAKYAYPIAGYYNASATDATFANMNDGEDFRSIWRHALDYTLYGNPAAAKTWNPSTHTIDGSTGNNYEYLSSLKVADFLEDAAGTRCIQWGTFGLTFKGAAETRQGYFLDGSVMNGAANDWHTNYTMGSAAAAILNSQHFAFMETMLRELFVTWDSQVKGDLYLNGSVPVYFHEWFRMLGLLVLTGNYTDTVENNINLASPEYKKANMKIYNAINKTYAFTGDTLTYWLNYRNYSSTDATGTVISETLPAAFDFSSATGPYTQAGKTITWNIGAVPGLHSYSNLNATMGGVTLVVRVRDDAPNAKYCTTADITCTNGTGWTSNDQPNEVTKICKTNCIDIVAAALTITKTASNHVANPGDTITYTISYCDSSSAGWINGGRYGVTFSIGENTLSKAGIKVLTIRGAHEATEPWLDWSNYRVSYFVNSSYHGVYNAVTNPTGWKVSGAGTEGTPGLDLSTEELIASCAPLSDPTNCWNQRLITAFQPSITLPTHILHKYFNNDTSMHYPGGIGTLQPLVAIVSLSANGEPAQDWTDDWSKLQTTAPYSKVDYGNGTAYFPYPITPDWTKGDGTSIPVTTINLASCNGTKPPIYNILVEEFDGYTWRRVFGDGPQPGRQVKNVFVVDSLPTGVTFGGFIDSDSATKTVSGRNITVNVGNMLVNQCSELKYWVTVNGTCPSGIVNPDMINTAFIYGDNESPVADSAVVSVTCAYVPPPPPAPSSITKTASTSSPALNSTFTYTIEYTNLNGTVVNSADASQNVFTAGNWTKRYGATGTWTFNGSQASTSADSSVYTYNYSHGTNGTVQLRASLQDGQDFAVVVRHTAGTAIADGIYIRFNSQWDGNRIQIYNGATLIGAAKIATSMKNLDIKIVLNDDTISVFQKNITDANFPPAADLSVSGIPIRAGYAGIANGAVPGFAQWTGGAHVVTSWHTELDTAFNILIHDPLPAALNYLGGTNSVTITAAGDIRWPVIPQMLKGASISYQWYAIASGPCGPVVNVVYAVPMGVTYTVAAQESIDIPCGVITPTFTPTSTRTITSTPTYTATNTATFSSTSTYTASPTQSWSRTETPSYTFTSTESFTPTFTSSVSVTNTFTNTYTPTSTSTVSPSQTVTDTISSNTPTFTLTSTNSFTDTLTWTPSASPTCTYTATPSGTPSSTATYTATSTNTGSMTQTATPTNTISSDTPTHTPTWTNTSTATQTWTDTNTATYTKTNTDTPTYTGTPTQSWTFTGTPTWTDTATYTATPTQSGTRTYTATFTATGTFTRTSTITATRTPTPTKTATRTVTQTATWTSTPMPSPVKLDISIETSGDSPAVGALITYTIKIKNNTNSPVTNIAVWDTLPSDMIFVSNNSEITPTQTGNYIYWNVANDADGTPFTLYPGQEITIEFTAKLLTVDSARMPLTDVAMADYNDPYYTTAVGKHPAISSETSFYPIGKPVVFPNPFNLDTNSVVTFDNIVPGSLIQIYTLTGEDVKTINAGTIKNTWDAKNRNGKKVSPGIYFFVIKNQTSGEVKTGKIFVVRGN